jgi:hypothetical protein
MLSTWATTVPSPVTELKAKCNWSEVQVSAPLPERVQRPLVQEAEPGRAGELRSASLHPGGSAALRVRVEVRQSEIRESNSALKQAHR